jgi:hypothetical protein
MGGSCLKNLKLRQMKGGYLMLFMAIFTYEPHDRDRVIARRLEAPSNPKGVEVKGEWFDVSGHRVFRLFKAKEAAHVAALFYNWTDLGVAELIPVVETELAVKLLKMTEGK